MSRLTILLGALTCIGLSSVDAMAFVMKTQIQAISAHFYYQETGTVDPRDLTAKGLALWNTGIGGGDARAASGATYVLVEISIDPEHAPKLLQFKARAGGQVLADYSVNLGSFFTNGSLIVVPFMVYGTGCQPLELTARFTGKGSPEGSLSRTVPFACGE